MTQTDSDNFEPALEPGTDTPGGPSLDEGACAPVPAEDGPEATEEAVPSPEEIAEWKAKAAQAEEHWDRLLRTRAELENYRKRAVRERQEAVRYANAALLEKLLPTLDHFDMAMAAAGSAGGDAVESLKTGLTMVYEQLRATLKEAGLEEIDALHQPFDPNFHEAVSEQPAADVPEGAVCQQIRKGYRLGDRLLRPASVVVARKPEA